MNIINYDSSHFGGLAVTRINELVSDTFPSEAAQSGTLFFLEKVSRQRILEECNQVLTVNTTEQNAWDLLKKINTDLQKSNRVSETFIPELQNMGRAIQSEDGYWNPVFYTIIMLTLTYLYFDLERSNYEGRDKNIDRLSRRQTLGEMLYTLEGISQTQKNRLRKAANSSIQKGRIAIVDEFVMAYKYYYVDLDAKKYTNYNNESSRDKAVSDYLEKLCVLYDTCSLADSIKMILYYKKDYKVI